LGKGLTVFIRKLNICLLYDLAILLHSTSPQSPNENIFIKKLYKNFHRSFIHNRQNKTKNRHGPDIHHWKNGEINCGIMEYYSGIKSNVTDKCNSAGKSQKQMARSKSIQCKELNSLDFTLLAN
jgi:hypothetical protein